MHQRHTTWRLLVTDVLIYTALQFLRIATDRLLPDTLLNPDGRRYRARRWEHDGAIYEEKFHISEWKDKLPSVDGFNTVSKKHLGATDPDHIEDLIVETCRGESHHARSVWETALFALWNPPRLSRIIFALSAIGHAPFIMIQRYNRPRLEKFLELRRRRAARAAASPAAPAPDATPASAAPDARNASPGSAEPSAPAATSPVAGG